MTLLFLAYRMFKGVGRRHRPRADARGADGPQDPAASATPLFLCLVSIVVADIAFAIDSIPAAFAITTDAFVIWMANAFALLGLRALFVLVEGLVAALPLPRRDDRGRAGASSRSSC